ncbi:DUF4350 domain-containing protein [Microcella humidisoli]|uniref:DUF4350 domain-containing protein n=1 Tax=Microcella humidisoli TaxID=2963406 RepID=A0ABY5FTQ0_9MICO|nr:DUF4350 domain-containing protein [Microcella humidisoli]UTT61666.1 DUF4350 domain-containing protein [Microcella humidisoli]
MSAPTTDLNAELSSVITTPTVRRAVRRSLYWAVAIAGLLVLGGVTVALSGASREPQRWGADETAPAGSRAVLEVLRDAGVEVVTVGRLDEALAALDGEGTTLFVGDTREILGDEQWPLLLGVADHLVIAEPTQTALDALRIDALTAAPLSDSGDPLELAAGCTVPAAERAGSVRATGIGYSTIDGEVCFDAGETGAGLVRLDVEGRQVSVLGAGSVLQNGDITLAGNAALALGLLGEHPTLVWYQPTPADLSAPTIGELTPDWVNPVAWLAVLVGLAAAFWRGRRFGPVVVENLPVVVKTTETMEGRARLYAREGSRLRAIDALRVGTLRRIAAGLALGRGAGVDDIVTAVAAITGRDPAALRALLIDREPSSDRELIELSDGLLELESHIARRVGLDDLSTATDPAPTGRMDA